MKAFSNRDKLKEFIAPNMTYLITFPDNNVKSASYTRGNINGIYFYLEMIEFPITLTTSGQQSHHLVPLYSINNDTSSLHTVITDIRMKQKFICKFYGRV